MISVKRGLTLANRVMFPKNSHNDNSNCFVFPLLSGEIDDKFGQNCELLITINPDRFLYHICIKTWDFIDFVRLFPKKNPN